MRRQWLYASLVVLIAVVVVSTGSFAAMTSQRTVDVQVVEDEKAFLGVETIATTAEVGHRVTVLRVTDNFEQDVDLDRVGLPAPGEPVALVTTGPAELEPHHDIVVTCTRSAANDLVEFSIAAHGPSVSVDKTKTVALSCELQPIRATDVVFDGCGNAVIDAPDDHFPLEVTLIGYSNGTGITETNRTVPRAGATVRGSPGQLVGLLVPETGLAVTNPNYDFDGRNCGEAGQKRTGKPGDPRDRFPD
jgi:hypothetical protein